MYLRRACLGLIGIATLGCSNKTTVLVEIAAPNLTISALQLDVAWGGKTQRSTSLPPGGGAPHLPGSVLLVLPDMDASIDLSLNATEAGGAMIMKTATAISRAHHQVTVAITLDEAAAPDMAIVEQPDFARTLDFASAVDLASADLLMPDLEPLPDLGPHNPLVQLGPIVTGGNSITGTLPNPSRAGTLLVFTFAFDKNADPTTPSGWLRYSAFSSGNNGELWYLGNNPGGVTSATSTLGGATVSVGQLSEWDTYSAMDQGCFHWDNGPSTTSNCTTPMTTHDKDLALTYWAELLGSAGTDTITPPSSSFTTLSDNGSVSTKMHFRFAVQLAVPLGAPLTETVNSSASGSWAGVIISFY